jgi:RNA polymerase sigma-70 factor (ECF subfamily)
MKTFEHEYKTHKDSIYRICYAYCNNYAIAEDLMQESFLLAWKNLSQFKANASFKSWLIRITINRCLAWVRKTGTNSSSINIVETIPAAESSSFEFESLYNCIAKLSEIDRIMISLHLENYTYKEIAEMLELTESNVGVRFHRIKNKLKDCILDYE